jgi:hypothetical protein
VDEEFKRRCSVIAPATYTDTFAGARLLCRIPSIPTDKCGQTAPLYASFDEPIDVSLRQWAKSAKTHPTDQNHLCEYRYNRHIHCAGKIAPANETATVWRIIGLHGDERGLRFTHAHGDAKLADFPLPCNPTNLDRGTNSLMARIRMERNRVRLRRLRSDYEADPRVERTILLGPPDQLLEEWEAKLYEASKDSRTPLRDEIDFYQQPISEHGSAEHINDGRERSPDDEKVSERQFDGINYDGMRETGSWQSSEQTEPVPEPNRERWLRPRRLLFNPLGKQWGEITTDDIVDVTDHPEFAQSAGEYAIEFSNLRVNEAAEQLGLKPNTLSQRISRQQLNGAYPDVDFTDAINQYFIVVTLNGRNRLVRLGAAGTPWVEVVARLRSERKKSEQNAIKQARKSGKDFQSSVERIRAAYDTVIGLVTETTETTNHEQVLEKRTL